MRDGSSCEPAGLGGCGALRGERGSLIKENTLAGPCGQVGKSQWLCPSGGSS